MKNNVLDVLLYIIENFISKEKFSAEDFSTLCTNLSEKGFDPITVTKALLWMLHLKLKLLQYGDIAIGASTRIYSDDECDKLSPECRHMIQQLEHLQSIDSTERELLIDCLMSLDFDPIQADHLKALLSIIFYCRSGFTTEINDPPSFDKPTILEGNRSLIH